jgi:hypothetical protein
MSLMPSELQKSDQLTPENLSRPRLTRSTLEPRGGLSALAKRCENLQVYEVSPLFPLFWLFFSSPPACVPFGSLVLLSQLFRYVLCVFICKASRGSPVALTLTA